MIDSSVAFKCSNDSYTNFRLRIGFPGTFIVAYEEGSIVLSLWVMISALIGENCRERRLFIAFIRLDCFWSVIWMGPWEASAIMRDCWTVISLWGDLFYLSSCITSFKSLNIVMVLSAYYGVMAPCMSLA